MPAAPFDSVVPSGPVAPPGSSAPPGSLAPSAPTAASDPRPVTVRKIHVSADRMSVYIACASGCRSTTPVLAARLRSLRPNLARHACVNGKGATFDSVMDRTPLPHLFEHLVIDILTQCSSNPGALFVGTSEWESPAQGLARVDLSFSDDMEAFVAIMEAARILNDLLGSEQRPCRRNPLLIA